jgi:S-(hydroxymethyl)glutathione dehydrogenase/alcohol dehydrogenase
VRAAVCRAFGSPLSIEELRLGTPGRSEVRVRVAACAICHSDVSLADGAWGGALPAVYGHEASGIVREVGESVTNVKPGDRVVVSLLRSCGRCFFCVRGESHLCEHEFRADHRSTLRTEDGETVRRGLHTATFAEETVVDESQVAVVPDSMPLDVAALIGCAVVTGFGAVSERADVPRGASVLVLGTGGVGVNCVQAAAIRGADPIVAADISPAKREAAIRFGATIALDPAAADLASEVRALTGARGADYVFVAVGRTEAIEQGLACVRRGGTVVVVGMPPAGETFRVVAVDLAHDDVRILGSKMGSAGLAQALPQLVELHGQGRLRLEELIGARYPFDRINDAVAAARDGDALRNVVVFGAD